MKNNGSTSRSPRVFSAACVCLALAAPLWAQQEPDTATVAAPILTLDQEALFARSQLGQRIISELDQERQALSAENRRIEAELSAEEKTLTEVRDTLSLDEFQALAAEFDQRVQRLRMAQDRKSRALQQRLDQERQNFAQFIGPLLVQIARERGATAILDDTVVLISFDSIDITAEAVARLDARIGDGTELSPVDEQAAPSFSGNE